MCEVPSPNIFHPYAWLLQGKDWVQSSLTEYSSSDDLSLFVDTLDHKAYR